MSKMDSFFNLSPLNTTASRKIISFSDISAVNLMVGWNLLACSINVCSINAFTIAHAHDVILKRKPSSELPVVTA